MTKLNIFLALLFFAILYWVIQHPALFNTAADKQFLIYRADSAFSESQKVFLQRNLNLEQKYTDKNVYDEDYVNILALNDEKVLSNIGLQCAIPLSLKPYNRKVTIRRQKSFGYFVIDFTKGLQEHSECIVEQFNQLKTNDMLRKYQQKAAELSFVIRSVDNTALKSDLYSQFEYYNSLVHILNTSRTIYTFINLSENHEKDPAKSMYLKFFLLINLFFVLAFFKKLISISK